MNLAPSTIDSYVQSYNMFLFYNQLPPQTTTDDICPQQVFYFINAMNESGIKPTSVNHYLRDLRAFLYWCMAEERAYIRRFKISLVFAQEEQLKLFTNDELERLLETPHKNDTFVTWRTWAIVNWVLATGNRASTICDIHISDIDFTEKEITLRHTKNKKAQMIPLSHTLEVALNNYAKIWNIYSQEDGYLFPNVGAEKLTTNALRLSFANYCKSRGVSRTNIHGLRHNFAKGWVKNGGNMFVLQQVLGHSTLEMTRKYVRLFSEDIKENYGQYTTLDTIKRGTSRTHCITKNKTN